MTRKKEARLAADAARRLRPSLDIRTTMTRQHFALIATVVDEAYTMNRPPTKRELSELFANALENTNPSFDRVRFLEACGC